MWQKQQQRKEIKDVSKDSEAEAGGSESSDINEKNTCTEASSAKFSVRGRLVNRGLRAVKIPCP